VLKESDWSITEVEKIINLSIIHELKVFDVPS